MEWLDRCKHEKGLGCGLFYRRRKIDFVIYVANQAEHA